MLAIACPQPQPRGDWHTERAIRARHRPHCQPGNLNGYVLDIDSYITGYGIHNRVIAWCPHGNTLYVRVDRKWGLRDPTNDEMLRVARFQHIGYPKDMRGKWQLVSRTSSDDHRSLHVTFAR